MIPGVLTGGEAALSAAEFRAVADILRAEARISLSEAKITLVQSRLARRLRLRQVEGFGAYLQLIDQDEEERAAMISALTTNHTHFFRENHHFEHLEREVAPVLRRRAEAGQPVRIWSAGCSSGEEPYSIVMTLAGQKRSEAGWLSGDVRLLATDLSPPMVEATRNACYTAISADQIPLPYRASWLTVDAGNVTIAPELRRIVQPRILNLFGEWPMRRPFDVIFCRNVMIYFDADARAELEQRLVAQLRPGGHLYIGHSERLSGRAAEQTVCIGQTIYRKREAA